MTKVLYVSSRADSRERSITKIKRLIARLDLGRIIRDKDLVAVKVSFGEPGNLTYLRPQYVRPVVDEIKRLGGRPFLSDSNTLYLGGRQNSRDHAISAMENGYDYNITGAPVLISGGLLGLDYRTVPVNGEHFESARIVRDILDASALVSLSHFKGHMICGFGGTIKNLGMGCASRSGKQLMHSDVHPEVQPSECSGCKRCPKWCPEDAIAMVPGQGKDPSVKNVARIDDDKCIGCGECVAVCPTDAIAINWKSDPAVVQQKMAEYARASLLKKEGKFAAINFIVDVTPDCDCLGWSDNPIVPNIGITASLDPVAVDAASLDLVNSARGNSMSALDEDGRASGDKFGSIHKGIDPTAQLTHGRKIGLGSTDYELVDLNRDGADGADGGSADQ
ncbi:MAG: DUF362 domain-containing protein, partial [Thermoleophilia bacterium]